MSVDGPPAQPNATATSSARRVDPRRPLGQHGERLAAEHMQRLGFRVLARNVRTRSGEIDLIAFDGRVLAFIEVKTRRCRSSTHRPQPLEWLRPRQCARVRRQARAWLNETGTTRPRAETIRFDAIGVVLDGRDRLLLLEHLEAAW